MTDPIPSIKLEKHIRDALYAAQAIKGSPVGYDDIQKELKISLSQESLSRYLRSMSKVHRFGIIKQFNGTLYL